MALADVPTGRETDSGRTDDVSRLILDRHDSAAFAIVSSLTVGELRDWLLKPEGQRRSKRLVTPSAATRRLRRARSSDCRSGSL
ncbi:ethanolamine ammonia-lyase subunit EutB [Bradyrhizobium sp. USDA 4486]